MFRSVINLRKFSVGQDFPENACKCLYYIKEIKKNERCMEYITSELLKHKNSLVSVDDDQNLDLRSLNHKNSLVSVDDDQNLDNSYFRFDSSRYIYKNTRNLYKNEIY
jgi:hypothetical protein